ncbi:MAG: hypothetical protein WD845_12135 [Pirellulales bacterium]
MLLAVLLAALGMAWVAQTRRQHASVEALRTSNPGATVLYDDRRPGDAEDESMWRRWARRQLGADYVATVTGVELFYATDADLVRVGRLSQLKWLSLVRSVDLTDAGLAHLSGLEKLETLILLDAEQVTDAGLRQLEQLTQLKHLRIHLGRHAVSNEALERLSDALPNCKIEVGEALKDGEVREIAALTN